MQEQVERGVAAGRDRDVAEVCIRKINCLLKREKQPEDTRSQAMGIIKRILALAEDNRIKLQSLFVTLVKALSASSAICACEERLGEFVNYL